MSVTAYFGVDNAIDLEKKEMRKSGAETGDPNRAGSFLLLLGCSCLTMAALRRTGLEGRK